MLKWLKSRLPVPKPSDSARSSYANDQVTPKGTVPSPNGAASKREGNAFLTQGKLLEAEACYRQAVACDPDYAEAYVNLGFALNEQARYKEAKGYLTRAIELDPALVDGYYLLGAIAQQQGDPNGLIENFSKVLEIKPDFELVHRDLCRALYESGQRDKAKDIILQGIALNPEVADFHYYLGNLYADEVRIEQAVASYKKALSIQPDYAVVHNNLALMLQDRGRYVEAKANFRRALQLNPDLAGVAGNLLFLLNYHPDKSAEEIFSSYREYDAQFGLPRRAAWGDHANSQQAKRRLKVGYVSPDFRQHAASNFLEPLLAHHDKEMFEIYAYAELKQPDAATRRYQSYADHWISTTGMSDEALVERIRADGIDILVDLAGHTTHNRLQVFTYKPAPVSVSWLGYGYTTGLTAIDYFLTDEASAPIGSEGVFSEAPWRLKTPAYAYRPAQGMGQVSSLPAQSKGHVTFGTLTRGIRVNHRTIRVWSEILKRVEGSRLVIDSRTYGDIAMHAGVVAKFAACGINRERLEIGYHSPPWGVLRGIDIGLDCFPHNSGTTLFETLYMGIPYVTLAGRPSVGRLGSTILQGVGHPEWIAQSEEQYVEKAVSLAGNLPILASIRSTLRAEMESSALMDEAGFARKVEAAYREMFQKWAGEQ